MADYAPEERAAIMKAMERVEGYKVGAVSTVPAASVNMPLFNPIPTVTTGIPSIPDLPKETASNNYIDKQTLSTPKIIVATPSQPIGRDVENRRLAHIVTGGISGN